VRRRRQAELALREQARLEQVGALVVEQLGVAHEREAHEDRHRHRDRDREHDHRALRVGPLEPAIERVVRAPPREVDRPGHDRGQQKHERGTGQQELGLGQAPRSALRQVGHPVRASRVEERRIEEPSRGAGDGPEAHIQHAGDREPSPRSRRSRLRGLGHRHRYVNVNVNVNVNDHRIRLRLRLRLRLRGSGARPEARVAPLPVAYPSAARANWHPG
jgi:hypothetical protein